MCWLCLLHHHQVDDLSVSIAYHGQHQYAVAAEQEHVNIVIVTVSMKDVSMQLKAPQYLVSGCKFVMQEAEIQFWLCGF